MERSQYGHLAVFAFSLLSLVIVEGTFVYVFAVVALLATATAAFFRHRSRGSAFEGNRVRRALLLSEGLGYSFRAYSLADIHASSGIEIEDREVELNTDYYAASTEPGPQKVSNLLVENAFFSKHLYTIMARTIWKWSAIALIVSIVILLLLPSSLPAPQAILIARAVIAFLTLLISIELLQDAHDLSKASASIGSVYDRLKAAIPVDDPDLMALMGDYNSAVQSAAVIPDAIYESHRSRLTKLFQAEFGDS